jgi:hypothetical protein
MPSASDLPAAELTIQEVVAACASLGMSITEATFAQYLQLGLLGDAASHRQRFPPSIVREIQLLLRVLAPKDDERGASCTHEAAVPGLSAPHPGDESTQRKP